MKQKCGRCGSCCVQLGGILDISEEDIRRWVNEFRIDILQYCYGWDENCRMLLAQSMDRNLINYLTEYIANIEMWYNPENREEDFKKEIKLCPFLRKKRNRNKFECMIEETKPEICRNYICNPKNMMEIVKRSFEENLKEYRKKRKKYPSFMKTSPLNDM